MSGRPRAPNLARRADLEAALKRAKARDEITLDGLARLMGVSKQRFINMQREIESLYDFPAFRIGPNKVHMFPAKKAIAVLLQYETRHDEQTKKLQEVTDRILGRGDRPKNEGEPVLPIGDLAVLSRVMAETEERERDQRQHIPASDVSATAANVFSMVSGFLGELDTHVDPNGLLPADVRHLVRQGGHGAALKLHTMMRDMLVPDAPAKPKRARKAPGKNGRPRRAPPRRPGKRSVGKPAR